ncbi:tRNA 2-selenouridine synthase [Abyssogena phaseoliformis symbiont OG214]|uniref:tRNA 2-selenouridine(34) synthase MnmH n=1 Tax=Abyssogena phaseoliformis symbiont TaxID=596095 RepID=UPI001915B44C|nr:tRNA 2-selenouridine(34) synthase MnmH [Abyssogena phaseoliformis symbiont]MBW5289253.1 tRNA 2-selenouridine synthase [Candidatus Ruthia sp. Apha_13_S6]BBB22720.1 tRNA 2-selenouridine synthase [Abyssogena phaseoliformis symbiont OG214]
MSSFAQIEDFNQLFINDTPLIDTRAPVEFIQGAFPHTHNLPLMSNEQRKLIGTCYKNKGQGEAIKLGHELIQDEVKNTRIKAWLEFIKSNPNGALYCFRGGLRSQITQRWIFETSGIEYPRINGGFKALRRFLIDESGRIMSATTPIVIGGQTGCGKTLLLDKIKAKIDLEGLANHRGSAFGNTTTSQPSQINFENELAIELIKNQHYTHLIFEDEGSNIGTVHIPICVKDKTSQADLVLLKASVQERIIISMDAYVINMHQDFIYQDVINGFNNFANYWLGSLQKIQKRLGLARYKVIHKMITSALSQHQTKNQFDGFYPVIKSLFIDYYDPMYNYQIKKKNKRIVFKGNAREVLEYLNTRLIS